MKTCCLIASWGFAALFWIGVAASVIDTLYDMHLLAGVVGLIVGLATLPLTFFVLPVYLIFCYGNWTLAAGTYGVLPLLGLLYFACTLGTGRSVGP